MNVSSTDVGNLEKASAITSVIGDDIGASAETDQGALITPITHLAASNAYHQRRQGLAKLFREAGDNHSWVESTPKSNNYLEHSSSAR
jgi:L,D-peptidoglycan transpeptidase YkuD (ErfK/YbiS/YcfS/YnhG family)